LIRSLKSVVRSSLRSLGLEIRKLRSHHTDSAGDQRRLLAAAPVRTLFDLGAHTGESAVGYRQIFPEAKIHSFEPTGSSFQKLVEHVRHDANIIPRRIAVGAAAGEATLHQNVFDQTNSLLPFSSTFKNFVDKGYDKEVGTETVPVVALDDYCRENQVDSIDLLKMDIQGFELNALRGAAGLLEKQVIRLIYTEVLFANQYQGQCCYHDIAGYLAPLGYDLYGLYDFLRGSNGILSHGNAIFLSREISRNL
jgi:FkbM family methyltransferase